METAAHSIYQATIAACFVVATLVCARDWGVVSARRRPLIPIIAVALGLIVPTSAAVLLSPVVRHSSLAASALMQFLANDALKVLGCLPLLGAAMLCERAARAPVFALFTRRLSHCNVHDAFIAELQSAIPNDRSAIADRSAICDLQSAITPWFLLLATAAAAILWSGALFVLFRPQPSPEIISSVESMKNVLGAGWTLALWTAWRMMVSAFWEETVFRGCLLTALWAWFGKGRWRRGAAVAIVSIVWALGHWGMAEPESAKFLQIFGAGLIFGAARARVGWEGCVLSHLALNLSAFAEVFFQFSSVSVSA